MGICIPDSHGSFMNVRNTSSNSVTVLPRPPQSATAPEPPRETPRSGLGGWRMLWARSAARLVLGLEVGEWGELDGVLYGFGNLGGGGGQETGESGDDRRDIGGMDDLAAVHLGEGE
ncbi:hypothetical protein O988_07474 [Pseudogymnoascus sp. VKM F-3808]|nr:hypothetical protein O988_07474 [Pseudogymnoascus sp. VKM F-3808]